MGLSFDGSTQWGVSASAIDFTAFSALSGSLWLYLNDWSSAAPGQIPLELTAAASANLGGFGLWVDALVAGKITLAVDTVSGQFYSKNNPAAAGWHHLAWNVDCSVAQVTAHTQIAFDLFIDGVDQTADTGTNGTAHAFANATLNLMARNNGAGALVTGRCTQLALWAASSGSILSSGDVTTLYNGGTADWSKVATVGAGAPNYGWTFASDGTAAYGGVNFTLTGSPGVVADPGAGSSLLFRRASALRPGCRGRRSASCGL